MAYYSPFVNRSGNPLLLTEIRYSHLSQLANIEEGYKIEFKSEWNNDVKKKHLAKTISSFANTEGGWLFIGITDDGCISPIQKERTDFGQQIGQIVKSTISPHPAFETRFITCPDDGTKGVLAIYVREGREPPYICNGTVYIRIGSNKEPVLSSHRTDIDNLIMKRKDYEEQLEKFCVDNVLDDDSFAYGVVYLYKKNPSKFINIGEKKTLDEIEQIAKTHGFESWMPSSSSILFFNSESLSHSSKTLIFELFFDYSMKLHIPLTHLPDQVKKNISQAVNQRNAKLDISNFTAIDGFLSFHGAASLFKSALSVIMEKGLSFEDYLLRGELKNIFNTYLFFNTGSDEWVDFVCNNSFRYSPKSNTAPFALKPSKETLTNENLGAISNLYAFLCLSLSFGYFSKEFFTFIDLNQELTFPHFPNNRFTNKEYYLKLFWVHI